MEKENEEESKKSEEEEGPMEAGDALQILRGSLA
jgi:hypothetical protein